jgi:N-methylhydantoinase B
VKEDVLDEYVSLEGARRDYGVILDRESPEVDWEATAALRHRLRSGASPILHPAVISRR